MVGSQPLKNQEPAGRHAWRQRGSCGTTCCWADACQAQPSPAQELRGCGAVDVVSTVAVLSGRPAIGICIWPRVYGVLYIMIQPPGPVKSSPATCSPSINGISTRNNTESYTPKAPLDGWDPFLTRSHAALLFHFHSAVSGSLKLGMAFLAWNNARSPWMVIPCSNCW